MKKIERSVHDVVDFLYMDGDLTSEFQQNKSMVDGTLAHQHWQSKYEENDLSEFYVKNTVKTDQYELLIRGRIDGVIIRDGITYIEEIKSTEQDLYSIEVNDRPQHMMQAKMYAYMYCMEEGLDSISVRLTYIHRKTYETIKFDEELTFTDLEKLYNETVRLYLEFEDKRFKHDQEKIKSFHKITFPFDGFRDHQRELMGAIYQTVKEKDVLYAIAPTGIGKTISSLFSSIKALENEKEKIFYLTAKNAGKHVAIDTMDLLQKNGLHMNAIEITSKETICFMDKVDCDPDICPYARGFFGRLKEATIEAFDEHQLFTHQLIEQISKKHTICPFEFSLFLSYFSDVIICDYNYMFDPRVYLKRYLDDFQYELHVLVDEAHNLVHRSRDMYSASLSLNQIKEFKPSLKGSKKVQKSFKRLTEYMDVLGDATDLKYEVSKIYDQTLLDDIKKCLNDLETALGDQVFDDNKYVLDLYFELNHFFKIAEFFREEMRFIIQRANHEVVFDIRCLDASYFIEKLYKKRLKSLIFFSATMIPLEYYQQLLTRGVGEHIYLPSPFEHDHLKVMIPNYISTRYRDREKSIHPIIDLINTMLKRSGNYIVFFPSYRYLNDVVDYMRFENDTTYLIQDPSLTKEERKEFIDTFKKADTSRVIGLFVIGGMFSEGIDYVGEMLDGVMIIGLGLPGFGDENETLKEYFDETFNKGIDYAYTYPGFNKVIQGVGRVIRTVSDRGYAILVDDRYLNYKYTSLTLPEWKPVSVIHNPSDLEKEINNFYK